jgi:hypothetical protein
MAREHLAQHGEGLYPAAFSRVYYENRTVGQANLA